MIMPGTDSLAVDEAARHIQDGGLVGFPTETVYGLGADASNDDAVAGIFKAKGRPANHPLIVHVAGADQVATYAASVPDFAARLMAAFWPGTLTVILPRKPGVASAAAGGQDSIGLRCPSHRVAQAFLKACGTGVAGPSANRFGRVSPTTAQHVQQEFGDELLVLDGGPCEVGIESTIIDCTRSRPVLLRPGVLTRAQLDAAAGEPVLSGEEMADGEGAAPRASGTLESHYAPDAKVRLMDARAIQTALDLLGADAAHIAVYARTVLPVKSDKLLFRRMPDDALATAQQLFAVLRDFDAKGVKLIWIETPPADNAWDGVRDRLGRAAAG
ncbi:MAG: L-threonylcarbamoyladenylate synthase [Polaromonas sp.]|nr:L-threonylcarbamoyladenylate synthase [Polaromonas sp.]